MSQFTTENNTETVILNAEQIEKRPYGFTLRNTEERDEGQYAKFLASAFLKFTQSGRQMTQQEESVQQFIAMADLHRVLTEEAQAFLQQDMQYVFDEQPIQPILLRFAAYRLQQASRCYYFASLQQSAIQLDNYKQVIKQCQAEYESLIQSS